MKCRKSKEAKASKAGARIGCALFALLACGALTMCVLSAVGGAFALTAMWGCVACCLSAMVGAGSEDMRR